ncbi:acyl-ACP--UDP-N-acetylglucosamine O-acyltransferase, partial [Hoylesella enoeca]|uniref:acyl-ACP--UDP-N-acetylglucosamine O-acyltransferase n=1 Tax=Hoylesella enoeca TaxID=76123 RepID=UPI00288A0419
STKPQDLKFKGEDSTCEIGDNNSIRENVTISRGTASKGTTIVGNNNLLMENMHIAHDCVFGSNLIVGNSTKFGGEVVVDDHAIVSAEVLCHQFCHIGGYVMVQGGSRTSQDIPPYVIAGKEPIRYAGINVVGLRRHGFSNELIELIHEAYRLLYSKGIRAEGILEIKKNLRITPEIQYIINFVEASGRGIIK